MAKLDFGDSEKERQAEENRAANLPWAQWFVDHAQSQCFTIKKEPHKYSLKCFLSPDNRLLWLEFRSTSRMPNLSCPISLHLPPHEFKKSVENDSGSFFRQVRHYMDELDANA